MEMLDVVAGLMTDDKPPDYGAGKNLVRHESCPLNYLYFCHSQTWLWHLCLKTSSRTELSPE